MPLQKCGGTKERDSFRNREVCVQYPQSLQITDTHHRWPARLVFSPPPPPRIMASGGPSSSSSSTLFLFWQHVCPSNSSVCLGQWQPDKEPAYPPLGCWIGGHVGLVIEGTIALGESGEREWERERVWQPRNPLQMGMVRSSLGGPEVGFELVGFGSFNGGQITSRIARNQYVGHRVKIKKWRFSTSVPSELCSFGEANNLLPISQIITHFVSRFKDNTCGFACSACEPYFMSNVWFLITVLPYCVQDWLPIFQAVTEALESTCRDIKHAWDQ